MVAVLPEMSLVVVNWNRAEDLRACLASIDRQTHAPAEIVVVDNGSTDGSAALVRERFPGALLVETGANLGFAEGFNRGVERCTRGWIATLNNDAEADPSWLEVLATAATRLPPTAGMLQSRIVFRHDPTRTNSTGVVFRTDATFLDRDFDEPVPEEDRGEEIFCVSAGAAAYRREMLEAVRLANGVFDRSFFMYFEDVDLGWRARLAGWDAFYVPGGTVRHAFQGSAGQHASSFVRLHCRRNRLRMLMKNGSAALVLRTLPRSLIDLAATAVREGPGVVPGFVRALCDGRAQRGAVGRLVRRTRRDVERRWIAARG